MGAEERRLLPDRRATYQKKTSLLNRHTSWLDDYDVRDVRTAQIEDFADQVTGLAPKTKADLLDEVHRVFKWAHRREVIERIPLFPEVKVPRKAKKYLLPEQRLKVLEEIPAEHLPIFAFMVQYGCRPAEACALCWDCVNLEQRIFVFARTFSRRQLSQSTKQRRDNSLPIMDWFAEHVSNLAPDNAAWRKDDPVFVNHPGRSWPQP